MKFTKEELLQEIAAGNRTIEGLAAKFGLRTNNMRIALVKLGISLKEKGPESESEAEPESVVIDDFAASDEYEWEQLYKDYDLGGAVGTQAQLMIAQRRIEDGMTAAEARQFMEDNFHYQVIEVKFKKKRR